MTPTAKPRPSMPKRIELSDPAAVKRWCEYFGVTAEQLHEAVQAVGPMAAAVEEQLLNQGGSAGAS